MLPKIAHGRGAGDGVLAFPPALATGVALAPALHQRTYQLDCDRKPDHANTVIRILLIAFLSSKYVCLIPTNAVWSSILWQLNTIHGVRLVLLIRLGGLVL
ncbi:hypothetical protein VFPPC_18390 [Pochonia chlamydosporia 170]|uniref:Uncharacterized protein n=1 Tax=Pochonia chlamydosporia 170 TaxID=1380566 RepID=A0A219AQQ1_METCM|nr:hypothetical protein VFPPC_18390 [Pochonia chlamydosporia 170]OWT42495.1 hypothetical protein VFPPC_18390 [Pochonia chlamydosporia 170]